MAIWKKQFTALRDGDRFFYGNTSDPTLSLIQQLYGISYQVTLAQLISTNTDRTASADVFHAPAESAPPPPPPTSSGLVAAYAFDEGSGTTVADASGNGNTGTISGANWTSSGKFGKALSFNGSTSWVSVADSASLDLSGGMTVEAWLNPAAIGNWRTAVMKEKSGGLAYALYASTGLAASAPSANVNPGTEAAVAGSSGLPLNSWTHLAGTYDGTTIRLYLGGSLIASQAESGNIAPSTAPLRIGGNSVWGEYFQGQIDEVRIYNRALSTSEIQTDMTTPVP
jgi:hypothetical protein